MTHATYPRPPRLLLTGSRYWGRNPGETDMVVRLLIWLRDNAPADTILITGGCPTGLDALVDGLWWGAFGRATECWPAAWDHCAPTCPPDPHRIVKPRGDVVHPGDLEDYCPGAGPRRNAAMVDTGPDVCLAFYGSFSKGSKGCADLATRFRIPTWRSPEADIAPWSWPPLLAVGRFP